MSTKRYCDVCGREITTNVVTDRITRDSSMRKPNGLPQRLQIEVQCGVGAAWNAGDLCKYCVIDFINALDDRPLHLEEVQVP